MQLLPYLQEMKAASRGNGQRTTLIFKEESALVAPVGAGAAEDAFLDVEGRRVFSDDVEYDPPRKVGMAREEKKVKFELILLSTGALFR